MAVCCTVYPSGIELHGVRVSDSGHDESWGNAFQLDDDNKRPCVIMSLSIASLYTCKKGLRYTPYIRLFAVREMNIICPSLLLLPRLARIYALMLYKSLNRGFQKK